MYRIKLASGQERVYPSIDELTTAVQGGEVNGEALIYHQRADRWLSVANHPHYQIATSRAQAQKHQSSADGSRRQIVNAVRPSNSAIKVDPNPPGTADAPRPVKRVSIPHLRKPEDKPGISAYENVLEGVTVAKPEVAAKPPVAAAPVAQPPATGNGVKSNGTPPQQTTVLPVRNTPPAPPAPVPGNVPDLGDGLDLVELEDVLPTPEPRAEMATPQVDKLLSLLEPSESSAPSKPITKPAPAATPIIKDVEFLDLTADHVKQTGGLSQPVPNPEPAAASHHAQVVRKHRSRKPMMMAVAAVAVLGMGLVVWHPWSARAANDPTMSLAAAPAPRTDAFGGTSSVDTATQPASGQPARDSAAPSSRDSAPAIVRVAAPRISMKAPTNLATMTMDLPSATQIPAATLIQHYTTAYSDARGEMEIRMLQIGFTQLFLKNRLASSSGVQDTRRLIAGAGSALRQYRSQEQRIERAYQDTVGGTGRNLGWTPRDLGAWNVRPSIRETAENARLTNLMLSQIDAVFALLQEQDGKYTITGETIGFDNADAARQYSTLRAWINQQADNYAGTGDAALPATLRQVIKGIGTTRLPQERSR